MFCLLNHQYDSNVAKVKSQIQIEPMTGDMASRPPVPGVIGCPPGVPGR